MTEPLFERSPDEPRGVDAAGNIVPAIDIRITDEQPVQRRSRRPGTTLWTVGVLTNDMNCARQVAGVWLRWSALQPFGRRARNLTERMGIAERVMRVDYTTRQAGIQLIGVRGNVRLADDDWHEAERAVFGFPTFEVRYEAMESVLDRLAAEGVERISLSALRHIVGSGVRDAR